jgi:hypothetical protein
VNAYIFWLWLFSCCVLNNETEIEYSKEHN